MRVTTPLLAVILLIAPTSLVAQVADPLLPGARIRYQLVDASHRRTGLVLERAGDTIVVAHTSESPRRVVLSSIADADVSRGRDRVIGAVKGVLWGVGIGAGLPTAYFLGLGAPRDKRDDWAFASFVYGAMGAMIGLPVGAIVGSERWQPAVVGTPRVGLVPRPRGVGLTFSWAP